MNTKSEINSIINELKSIIKELESIANGIEKSFTGIGQEKCAASIRNRIGSYKKIVKKLENVDPSVVVEFIEKVA